uniref:Uncharacterized protein n=1 Tax=Lates calcarifer TaxID=8187 RepID=A0A4W6FB93_LATCA
MIHRSHLFSHLFSYHFIYPCMISCCLDGVILFSSQVVIAGSVAVAAQNLHLPTLRACLGMQIVACAASLFNMICSLVKMEDMFTFCWHYAYDNNTLRYGEICQRLENTQSHFYAESVVIQAALLAISATLAAYCCKVVNCCSPAPKMPVITVQAPPVQQQEDGQDKPEE